jgi:hypothetical protein
MLDYRAWIVACVILLSAAGAYLLWIYRPKATYNARSLSAGAHPSDTATKPVTKSLHVDGCRQDFIVSPGELVEPTVVPGASLDSFHDVYGKETKRDPQGALTWDKYEYSLTADGFGGGNPGSSLWISLNSGHILESLDGVELGLDSMGTIFRKMRDKKVEVQERIRRDGDHWILMLSLDSACGGKFRSEYFRSLPSDPETDRQINRRIVGPDGEPGPLRSDVFMNKVVYDYVMRDYVMETGKDDSGEGGPSEHE